MRNKKLFLVALLVIFALPVQAIKPIRVQRAVSKARSVVSGSALANRAATARLHDFASRAAQMREINTAFLKNAFRYRKKVFEVQIATDGRHTASAFALNIQGRVWGVTAAHVMHNISSNPFIKIKKGTETILAPIPSWHIGNKIGNDVAIFEIPQEILPHIEVLSPSKQALLPATQTQSPAFVRGNYTFLPSEDVLFVGPHRIFLRDQLRREATGYCGSPVLVNGEVVGLHVGVYSLEQIRTSAWSDLLNKERLSIQSPLHTASPISHVLQLAHEVEPAAVSPAPTLLKVLGHTVRPLAAREQLVSVALLRNGVFQQEIHAHPFMNFDKLEEFFELQENDVLRLTINQPKPYSQRVQTVLYDVNVSTGEIKKWDR